MQKKFLQVKGKCVQIIQVFILPAHERKIAIAFMNIDKGRCPIMASYSRSPDLIFHMFSNEVYVKSALYNHSR
jgi:hypothetical protein